MKNGYTHTKKKKWKNHWNIFESECSWRIAQKKRCVYYTRTDPHTHTHDAQMCIFASNVRISNGVLIAATWCVDVVVGVAAAAG